jgi:tRNA dimethylallyltransferase
MARELSVCFTPRAPVSSRRNMTRQQPTSSAESPATRAGFYLVGATAVGKSAVAQWIAETGGCDILSADSMLVYSGMDVGTAKPSRAARSRVRYHGLDLVAPDCAFSLGRYLECVRLSLPDVAPPGARGAAPAAGGNRPLPDGTLVVGGTGLYVKALLCGLAAAPPSNPSVRAYWNDVLDEQGVEALAAALRRKSPGLFENLRDHRNPRRLLRALELAESGSERPERTWPDQPAGARLVGLRRSRDDLNARIEERVQAMYAGGLPDEARALRQQYPALSETARQAIGYAEALDCLDGRCSTREAIERTVARTRQLAKRQRTWFAHQLDVQWIEVAPGDDAPRVAQQVLAAWSTYGPVPIRV